MSKPQFNVTEFPNLISALYANADWEGEERTERNRPYFSSLFPVPKDIDVELAIAQFFAPTEKQRQGRKVDEIEGLATFFDLYTVDQQAEIGLHLGRMFLREEGAASDFITTIVKYFPLGDADQVLSSRKIADLKQDFDEWEAA